MLYEPIQYVITGKRICQEDICAILEEMGKAKSLYKMWKGSLPYLQSIANKVLLFPTPFCHDIRLMLLIPPQDLNAIAAQALANPPQ